MITSLDIYARKYKAITRLEIQQSLLENNIAKKSVKQKRCLYFVFFKRKKFKPKCFIIHFFPLPFRYFLSLYFLKKVS